MKACGRDDFHHVQQMDRPMGYAARAGDGRDAELLQRVHQTQGSVRGMSQPPESHSPPLPDQTRHQPDGT